MSQENKYILIWPHGIEHIRAEITETLHDWDATYTVGTADYVKGVIDRIEEAKE